MKAAEVLPRKRAFKERKPMRIATWNIDRCRPGSSARATQLAELMGHVKADVWVLTETHRDFRSGPGYELIAHSEAAADRDASKGECWAAIWARQLLQAEPLALRRDPERVAAA